MATIKDCIFYCKKKLERGVGEDKTLHILRKLHKLPMTVELLQETGIGKLVNSLRKQDGEIGERASAVVSDWRQMVTQSSRSEKKPQKCEEIAQKSHVKEQKYYSERAIKEEYGGDKEYLQQDDDYTSVEQSYGILSASRSASGSSGYYSNECDDYETEYGHKLSGSNQQNKHFKNSNKELHRSPNVSKHQNKHKNLLPNEKTVKQKIYNGDIGSISSVSNKHRDSSSPVNTKSSKNMYSGSKGEYIEPTPQKKPTKESSGSSKKQKTAKKLIKIANSEGFTNSVASFEDCLGLNDAVKIVKKKSPPTKANTDNSHINKVITKANADNRHVTKANADSGYVSKKHPRETVSSKEVKPVKERSSDKRKTSYSRESDLMPEELKKPKLVPVEQVDILSTLPPIQPNYRPTRIREPDSPPRKKRFAMTNEEAIMFTSSRKDRTNVYAGRRVLRKGEEQVPTLYDQCIRILIENVDDIAYTGGVPFEVLKPVIERCSPSQLYTMEDYNPYLLEDTDYLWMAHCQKDFKHKQLDENETWRDLYLRSYDEREAKFHNVAAYISESMKKATPVRQTKLAYIDTVAKPPRDVRRRQAKHGTGSSANLVPKPIPLINPSMRSASPVAVNSTKSSLSSRPPVAPVPKVVPQKPKVAPLMQKTLKLMKAQFRR